MIYPNKLELYNTVACFRPRANATYEDGGVSSVSEPLQNESENPLLSQHDMFAYNVTLNRTVICPREFIFL